MTSTYREIGIITETENGSIKYVSRQEAIAHLKQSAERLIGLRVEEAKRIATDNHAHIP
ncbi:MAG: hypothetical protein PHO26_02075 [Dehalococcoidia bacterium]|nr:hypothetical protein [Dehalococcoidia bacterium]MDD5495456.1 hypothetical protein [Dehalococcoidia bacterium]